MITYIEEEDFNYEALDEQIDEANEDKDVDSDVYELLEEFFPETRNSNRKLTVGFLELPLGHIQVIPHFWIAEFYIFKNYYAPDEESSAIKKGYFTSWEDMDALIDKLTDGDFEAFEKAVNAR